MWHSIMDMQGPKTRHQVPEIQFKLGARTQFLTFLFVKIAYKSKTKSCFKS